MVDEHNDYMEWTVNVVIPVNWVDPGCVEAYASANATAARAMAGLSQ